MRVLVLGAGGMAGHLITIYLNKKGYDVVGFARRKLQYCSCIVGDAMDVQLLTEVIKESNFNVIINCIGILNNDAETDREQAVFLNGYLPHFLVKLTENMKTKIIHLSTDCIFSGNTGNYTENSFPDGRTFYDRTKAIGEINDEKNLTFRNSIVGPDINKNGKGLFQWFMQQSGTIRGFTGVIWTGVSTYTLAQAIDRAICDNLSGLYNLVNNERISKYELLTLFNKYFRDNQITIIEDSELQINKSLLNTRKDWDFEVPDYEKMIRDMRDWVKDNKNIYQYY